jgi:hypothetical protein
LREASAGRLKARTYAHFLVHRTLSIQAAIAEEALTAGYVVKNNDAIARRVFCDPIADSRDYTGSLVAVDARGRKEVVLDFLEIGVADAAALDPDQDFAAPDKRGFDGFDRDSAWATIHGRSHDARYCIIRRQQYLTSA